MAEPVAEPVVALFAFIPVRHARPNGRNAEKCQHDEHRAAIAVSQQREDEHDGNRQQDESGENRHAILIRRERLHDAVRDFRKSKLAVRTEGEIFPAAPFGKRQPRNLHLPRLAKVKFADGLKQRIGRQHCRHTAANQTRATEIFVVRGDVSREQDKAVANQDGEQTVRRGEENFVQVRRGAVGGDVQHHHQLNREHQVNRRDAQQPAAFAGFHFPQEQ